MLRVARGRDGYGPPPLDRKSLAAFEGDEPIRSRYGAMIPHSGSAAGPSSPCTRDQAGRVGHVRRPALMHEHLRVRELRGRRPEGPGVVEMNVGHEDRGILPGGDPAPAKPVRRASPAGVVGGPVSMRLHPSGWGNR